MSKAKFILPFDKLSGAMDSKKEGRQKRQRLVTRYRNGSAHFYPMKMHEGAWAEGATKNRELFKAAMSEAHAIDKAAKHPELATQEYIEKAAKWQRRFKKYKASKKRAEKKYSTLYTFVYASIYNDLKAEALSHSADNQDAISISEVKTAKYESLIPQIQALVADETDFIANMANIAAALHEAFGFWWTGFYRVMGDELVLGPFQGPLACTRIPFGRGVCGTAWAEDRTIIVPNVHKFPGHIACSSASKSEIVVPVRLNGQIIAVLDIDSENYNTFDDIDKEWLEKLVMDN